jgi:hypothetical protein
MQPDVINVAQQEAQAAAHGGVMRRLIALDQFLNVWFFNGRLGETISAHSYRAALAGHKWGVAMNWALNLIQADHGAKAAAGDLERANAIVAVEDKTLNVGG